MAVRIRVYPNGGMGGMGGAYGAYGPVQVARVQLQNEKKTGNLRLQYERALWQEKIKTAQLATAMQYQTAAPAVAGPWGAFGSPLMGAGMAGAIPPGFGMAQGMGLGMAGLGMMMPGLMAGSGQTNITNQSGSGNQTVTNSNHHSSSYAMMQPPMFGGGFPFGGFGGGGLLSGLLGALI